MKQKSNGTIERFKSPLVAKILTLDYRLDYEQMFASVAKINVVCDWDF